MFGIKVLANDVFDEEGKELTGYWDGSKDNLLDNLKTNPFCEGVRSFDTYEEAYDECLNLNIEYVYEFEIIPLNVLGIEIDLTDEVAPKWDCKLELYEYEKHYKVGGYVNIDKVKEDVYNSCPNHCSKDGYPYVTKKLIEVLKPTKEETYSKCLQIVDMISKGCKITTKNCIVLNYGIMAAKIMREEVNKERDEFLVDAADIYLPKYIDKVMAEYDARCEVFNESIASFRKAIIDYNAYLLPIKIKEITALEKKKIAMKTITGTCNCKSPIDIRYHKNYCGECGKKIDWEAIYKKTLI